MKSFTETFPKLKNEEGFSDLWQFITVSKVSAKPDMSELKVYIRSERLIEKKRIYDIEKLIKDRLFPYKKIRIRLIEKFNLSKQYNLENLYASYIDSILLELRKSKIIYYNMLTTAKAEIKEKNTLELSIEKNTLYVEVMKDFIELLEKIFIERCGLGVYIKVNYLEYSKPAKAANADYEDSYISVTKEIKKEQEESKSKAAAKEKILEPAKKEESKEADKGKTASKYPERKYKKSSNPDVLYGRDFTDNIIPIKDIQGEMGEVVIAGSIIELDTIRIEKTQSTIYICTLSDYSDSIVMKLFIKDEQKGNIEDILRKGNALKVCGQTSIDRFDSELTLGFIRGIKKYEINNADERVDDEEIKRVELHCHTKMSDFDGVSSAEDIIKEAQRLGMSAIAITDHGNVQNFTEAYHVVEKLKSPFKVIYGMEAYVVDDVKSLVLNPGEYSLDDDYVVFDIETTGFSAKNDKIIEIGAVKISNSKITDRFSTLINPKMPIPLKIEELTKINDSMVLGAPVVEEVLPKFYDFIEGAVLVAHNASFDVGFIREKFKLISKTINPCVIDTVEFARLLLPNLSRFKLDTVAKNLGISLENHHRAVDDAEATAYIWLKFVDLLKERYSTDKLKELEGLNKLSTNVIRKLHENHVTLLAKNDIGRINLYRLVSLSHTEYYNKIPRIPKSLLIKYREGLILGSACSNGELFQALLRNESEEKLGSIVDFYDFLEIQDSKNNLHMVESDRYSISSEEDIREINKEICRLGKTYEKLVVATGDVHFLNPKDEVYRRILMYGKGFERADKQPPLYLKTTKEMLKDFEYLGQSKAYEVVVTNSNKIAAMVENIIPVRPDKCAPVIENSDEMLRAACYEKAYEQYGNPLPKLVEARLERELNSIIKNGFAVMYIIAKKLVEKSNSDGYLVGSRGSVGSSFAAYTSGITEVNPLPPHYYCTCKYVDFDSEEVKQYVGMAGCDMPDKVCPLCGNKLKKDGFDIPFETFLGFKGDKEPDIDLNFSGEYQSNAHDYTEVLFGKGHTFRAGTVSTLQFKTAYGYVKNYYEEHGERKRKCEIARLSNGCVGIRRTTGQHPGGIIVLPHGEEIYSFTPVQRPANDVNSKTVTTHFDYHAIDHNLLKLDILGHQDPTMIRMLQDITGIDPVKDIPLDSKETMSLFKDTSALGISPDDIMGCKLGALGVPEFGTDFAMQMLIEAKPEGLSDLVRIAGLAHGTDVWLGNAQTLIKEGTATIRTAICTRDDIMIYLIEKGIEEGVSFKIMEAVRKGKGLKPEEEEIMRKAAVPKWYIDSCKKIKYMFPKAHAAAYVMMAWRIAYCKIFYPLAYYSAYFTIRASSFSYEIMCFGKARLEEYIAQYQKKQETSSASAKDEDTFKDMRIAQEMYARGFEFEEIDIYRAEATKCFITDNNKIMPPLSSIDGFGEVAANQLVNARKAGEFISKDDLMERAKIGKSTCELLDRLGLLKKLPQSNQMSIFDVL